MDSGRVFAGFCLEEMQTASVYSECYPNTVTWSLVKAGEIDFSGEFENPKVWPSIALTSAQGQKNYCF